MALFDQAAKDYDSWYHDPVGKYVDDVEMPCILSLAGDLEDKRVLDIGCGTGHLSEQLFMRGAQVTGVDISEGMLYLAKKKRDERSLSIQYLKMDAYNLTFDEPFDMICSMASFEFIDDMDKVFQSMNKVLAPNGAIIIGTIQKDGAWATLYESKAFSKTVFANATFRSLQDFESIKGFKVVASKQCLYVPPAQEQATYTLHNEEAMKKINSLGGFLCVKMQRS